MLDGNEELQESVEESWGEALESAIEPDEVVDEQPEKDSETEAEEATDVEQDVVEPDSKSEEDESDEETDEESEEEQEETPAFDDDTEIELGEDKKPVKLAELKKGYLRQSDYTKKTQELSTQREEVEQAQEKLKPVQDWLERIETNPYVFQQIEKALTEYQNTGILPIEEVLQDAQYSKYINHLWAENTKLTKERDSLKGEFEGVKFNTDMDKLTADLVKDYGDAVTDEYIEDLKQQAKDNNYSIDVAKKIAKGDLADQKLKQEQEHSKKAKRETEAKTIQSIQEKRQKLPPQPKSKGQRPGKEPVRVEDMSWSEALEYAVKN